MTMLKSIRLNVPASMANLSVNISFDKKNHKFNKDQIETILKMKDIIDSFTSCKTALTQVPMHAQNDTNPKPVELCTITQSKKLENGNNSNNELLEYKNNEGYIDLTKEFNINNETTEANLIEESSFFNSYLQQYESDIAFLYDDDDPNDNLSENFFLSNEDNNTGNEFLF